jgi:hypothetical protein
MLNGSWTNSRTRKFKITHNFNDSIYTGKNINGPKKIDPYIFPSLPKGMLTFSDILREYGVGSLLPKVNIFFDWQNILYQHIKRNLFDIDFFYCHFCPSLYSNILYILKNNFYVKVCFQFFFFLLKKKFIFFLITKHNQKGG